jgi:hypothetical protein
MCVRVCGVRCVGRGGGHRSRETMASVGVSHLHDQESQLKVVSFAEVVGQNGDPANKFGEIHMTSTLKNG